MKSKPTKTPAQLAKEAATKRATNLEACHAQCRKLGKAARFSFLRIFMRGLQVEETEAMQEFEKAVKEGRILEVGKNAAGDVKFFFAKGLEVKR